MSVAEIETMASTQSAARGTARNVLTKGARDPRDRTAHRGSRAGAAGRKAATQIDRNRIATFVKVAEAGSFTAAAAALDLPKSSVSRNVAGLEADLGVLLLQRTTRKLSLTDAGRSLFRRVQQAMIDLDQAIVEVSDENDELRGPIRITAPTDFAEIAFPEIMARFLEQHPCVQIELSLTGRRVDLVEEGFDLAVRAGALADSTLMARRIGASDLGIFGAASYLAKHGRPRSVTDLARHNCLFMKSNTGILPWRLDGPRGPVVAEVSGSLTADNFGFLRRAVAAGVGLGLLPVGELGGQSDDLVRVLPAYGVGGGAVHVVWPSSRYLPARVAAFREFLVDELTKCHRAGAGAQKP
jgi:DNA-binding transcriptional LysR family regulator